MAGSSSRDLKSAAMLPWESICHHVNKAVVFLDGPATECLHWVGGMQMLLKAGAVNVKEFSSFEVCMDVELHQNSEANTKRTSKACYEKIIQ